MQYNLRLLDSLIKRVTVTPAIHTLTLTNPDFKKKIEPMIDALTGFMKFISRDDTINKMFCYSSILYEKGPSIADKLKTVTSKLFADIVEETKDIDLSQFLDPVISNVAPLKRELKIMFSISMLKSLVAFQPGIHIALCTVESILPSLNERSESIKTFRDVYKANRNEAKLNKILGLLQDIVLHHGNDTIDANTCPTTGELITSATGIMSGGYREKKRGRQSTRKKHAKGTSKKRATWKKRTTWEKRETRKRSNK